ncbi:MAG: hypothetical protein R2744_11425 [Bacteroidales bacterium]
MLEEELGKFRDNVVNFSGGNNDPAIIDALELNHYLPVRKVTEKGIYFVSPIALAQSLQLLKGSILDAEAYVIRNAVQINPITE